MDNLTKKYNRLSVIGFILILVGFVASVISETVSGALVLFGVVLGIVSYFEIKKTGEKGRGLAITSMVVGIILVIFISVSMLLLF
jgi:hypothetical protein